MTAAVAAAAASGDDAVSTCLICLEPDDADGSACCTDGAYASCHTGFTVSFQAYRGIANPLHLDSVTMGELEYLSGARNATSGLLVPRRCCCRATHIFSIAHQGRSSPPFTPSRSTRQLRCGQCSVGAAGLEDDHQGSATSDYLVMGVWLQVVLSVYLAWRCL